ncbi:MAG: NAD/NADP octopine/nopaline dehydrogenase family protein [Anaerolineaceae bacterium]|nr:NAD/NADP octopine/nopaline dehydrogenase family protein [Anaerolineaceae bacterium]
MSAAERFAIIGAGNGGKSMAAHLGMMGADVTMYNRTYAHIEAIARRGGIEISSVGGPNGFGLVRLATDDMELAIKDAEVIMVVVPSYAHAPIAKCMAPYLKNGQVVVLNPGRTFGAMEFEKTLCDEGCTADVTIAETETFIYACRAEGPAQAHIFRIKDATPLAALPATKTEMVLEKLSETYPQFINGKDVLHTSLNNMGAIFHPTLSILNAARIESTTGNFQFYIEGVTPSVALVLEAIDRERVTVASALGIRARTAQEWLQSAYNVTGENLNEAIHNQTGYIGIKAPGTLNNRYITEDVPMSLVPIADIGQRYGVSVRGIDSIIRLACIIHRTDYWRRGRTLKKLGIDHMTVPEMQKWVLEGYKEAFE